MKKKENSNKTESSTQEQQGTEIFINLQYRLEPDYTKPLLNVPLKKKKRITKHLASLYGRQKAEDRYSEVERIMKVHYAHNTSELVVSESTFDPEERFTEKDIVLISYGDLIVSENKKPLKALADFATQFFKGLISTIHILPFFPFSSDRGFSVISYDKVDPQLGTWEDITELKKSFKLMFDGVINHCSSKSNWFRRFLGGDPDYQDFFTAYWSKDAIDEQNLRRILRPRTSSLLTEYATINGPRYVWTTFSPDQIDLNFKNPKVLLTILETLLNYVRRGADIIRLDAVTYLWYEIGSTGAHLEQTHTVVKLIRDVLDVVSRHVAIITETNVPHRDNITYFGSGEDEAQMIYNFPLPPLVLHTFISSDSTIISKWAANLKTPSKKTAFFNFLDSHDGIGVMGAKGILSEEQIKTLCQWVESIGGFVSTKDNGDGTESPYELNTTWFSALNGMNSSEPLDLQVNKFIASRAIALSIKGVPAIYLPSMFGYENDVDAVYREGSKRSINRSAILEGKLLEAFRDGESIPHLISKKFINLLEKRISETAFHPNSEQHILDFGAKIFAVVRIDQKRNSKVLSLINVTSDHHTLKVPLAKSYMQGNSFIDIVSGKIYSSKKESLEISLNPYQVIWVKKHSE